MATRQKRIDEFTHDGAPPADQPLEILCEDHVGTYLVPFPCRWRGDDWTNADTGEPMGPTIRADHTATFVDIKTGFVNPAAHDWLGQVHVVAIGIVADGTLPSI